MFLSISQRYILKANHNYWTMQRNIFTVFINKSKIHFESKSQPAWISAWISFMFLSISQRYILKANHNYFLSKVFSLLFLSISQRYILKANHNLSRSNQMALLFLSISQRYILKANHNHYARAKEEQAGVRGLCLESLSQNVKEKTHRHFFIPAKVNLMSLTQI